MGAKRLEIVKDETLAVFQAIEELVGKEVLIGIPESKNSRQAVDGEAPINNAALGYLHEFGSPAQNIPARAFLIPGVQKAEKPALYQLRKAADATLDGQPKKADQYLNAAGVVGSNSARNEISTANFAPLSPATIRNRHRQRGTKSMRESEQVYLMLVSKGVDPGAAQTETDIRPLINTGQLRNSITYVVRKR